MIRIENLVFAYNEKNDGKTVARRRIFDGFSAALSSVTCITGPSGCGKTTLLRLIAGLEKPQEGVITGVPERVSVMFQEDRLLPWLSARRNIEAVLPPERSGEAAQWLRRVELDDCLDSLPESLSGGQKRRVALARALAFGGGLLILDEPFKGFDPALTERMAALIKSRNVQVIAAVHAPEEMSLLGGEVIRLA
jgi:ABC-type nitrate/sulfonate/bicarbonate transport system ATPase subunit